MKTRSDKFDEYKKRWKLKPKAKIEAEILSMRKFLEKNKDTFFHECAPDELTDGLRLLALREALAEAAT
jgi:hypothetical protein